MATEGQVRGRALFVRRARFSHVNQSLLAALRRQRPDIVFDDLDVDTLLPPRSLAFQTCILRALAEYGPGTLRNRNLLRFRVLRSRAYYHATRRLIREKSTVGGYLFTVQTQSLFNAANGLVPNLIYTDHASLARESSDWDEGLGDPSPAWLALEAAIYRDAAHVFTFGSRVRQVLVDRYGLPEGRATCAGTGANVMPDAPPDLSPARYERRNILFAGIEWERKGGPDLLAAFKALQTRLPDATLTIVGCTPPEAQGVPGCDVLGRVSLPELARLYLAASCLSVPSRHEPFGNVFVEAGHFGLPVVATRVGEIGDVVHDGKNGFRVPPSDPPALAQALWQVLHDPEAASRMAAEGIRITADYTWDTVAARMLAHAPLDQAQA
ncbi:glycosyltransferase family 4 protein [Tabrizicola sp.]|uniref:glycosyltransferase family 4 protein n=1 Tax=Tabrizicola sp. TaxID=2005166 RepID=UPI003F2F0AA7